MYIGEVELKSHDVQCAFPFARAGVRVKDSFVDVTFEVH